MLSSIETNTFSNFLVDEENSKHIQFHMKSLTWNNIRWNDNKDMRSSWLSERDRERREEMGRGRKGREKEENKSVEA